MAEILYYKYMKRTDAQHLALHSLRVAAERGDITAAQTALDAGAPINGRMEFGKTPFMFAVENAQIAMLTFLKQKGARVNMIDEDGGHGAIFLFTNGGVVKDGEGKPEHISIQRKTETLRTLMHLGCSPEATCEDGTPMLHYVAHQMPDAVILEFVRGGANLRQVDQFTGNTFLHCLAYRLDIGSGVMTELVRNALDQGVSLGAKKHDGGQTANDVANKIENRIFNDAIHAYASLNTKRGAEIKPRRRMASP